MARLQLSKARLARERRDLARYRRYLPALDLKRKSLMQARARAAARIEEIAEARRAALESAGAEIPMLADRTVDLTGLVRLARVRTVTRNLVGVDLPELAGVEIERAAYGAMTRPHWVDAVARRAEAALRLAAEQRVAERRLALLEAALAKTAQRVNLFEKVLIPGAEANIRRISIALGDRERAAVVTSKIAKRKRERA